MSFSVHVHQLSEDRRNNSNECREFLSFRWSGQHEREVTPGQRSSWNTSVEIAQLKSPVFVSMICTGTQQLFIAAQEEGTPRVDQTRRTYRGPRIKPSPGLLQQARPSPRRRWLASWRQPEKTTRNLRRGGGRQRRARHATYTKGEHRGFLCCGLLFPCDRNKSHVLLGTRQEYDRVQ